MFIHAAYAARHCYTKVAQQTANTDVLVITISQMSHLGLAELWLEFGVVKHYHAISVHDIVSSLSCERLASALHALTRCDTTSAFTGMQWEIHLYSTF